MKKGDAKKTEKPKDEPAKAATETLPTTETVTAPPATQGDEKKKEKKNKKDKHPGVKRGPEETKFVIKEDDPANKKEISQPETTAKDKDQPEIVLEELNAEEVQYLLNAPPIGESPINLSLEYQKLKPINLSPLMWHNFHTMPLALKLTNTSYSLIMTGKWYSKQMPYINGGPLREDYVFTQLHFHWGGLIKETENYEANLCILSGSEHTVEGEHYPFEMHAVFHKRSCENHDAAKRVKSGIIILVYICADITEEDNPRLIPITKKLCRTINCYDSRAVDPVPLQTILPEFDNDYILYSGYMKYKCNHGILWLISRQSIFMSIYQLSNFQGVLDKNKEPIRNPFRDVQSLDSRYIFIVNPVGRMDPLLHFRSEDLPILDEEVGEQDFDEKSDER